MSMMAATPMLAAGGIPREEVLRQLGLRRRRRAMTGPYGGVGGLGETWSDWLQNLATSWSSAGQQILVNQNPQTATQTTAQGTTTYYPGSTVPVATTAAASSGLGMVALAAGAVVVVVMMLNKR